MAPATPSPDCREPGPPGNTRVFGTFGGPTTEIGRIWLFVCRNKLDILSWSMWTTVAPEGVQVYTSMVCEALLVFLCPPSKSGLFWEG